jgi:hypothetical protein
MIFGFLYKIAKLIGYSLGDLVWVPSQSGNPLAPSLSANSFAEHTIFNYFALISAGAI